jgi:hypothetical protein
MTGQQEQLIEQRFEKWYLSLGFSLLLKKDNLGVYLDRATRTDFETWKAAYRSALQLVNNG